MSEWQPIETAPKDKPIILARGERVTVGEWSELRFRGGRPQFVSWDGGFTKPGPPTHWMPLPEPPQ